MNKQELIGLLERESYRIDNIEYKGTLYMVEMKNGTLTRVTQ